MEFGLIIVGDEILSGKRADKHLSQVISLLSERGLGLSWVRYVGDDPRRLTQDLRDALAGPEAVFCCGGIGATPDDHTRQCAADALGVPLALHPEARALITERMQSMAAEKGEVFDPDRADNLQRLKMGCFPVGAQIIANPYNKIPGFSVKAPSGTEVFFVPGFPVMAWPMIEAVLDARFAHAHGSLDRGERSVIVFSTMESLLTPLMEALEARFEGIKVFSLPSEDHPQWGKHIELGVKGPAAVLEEAYAALRAGLTTLGAATGPEMVR
ncbi:MAG: molybdopterin-binding protein [Pseudomonadota bacterium]